jgi:hypothetical protein
LTFADATGPQAEARSIGPLHSRVPWDALENRILGVGLFREPQIASAVDDAVIRGGAERGQEAMTVNAWDKAAACEAHARSSKDQKLQEKFRKLRDSWIHIANNERLSGDRLQDEGLPENRD